MKKVLVILLAVLLCASVANAYVYRTVGVGASGRSSFSRLTGAVSLQESAPGLGPVEFKVHPYTIDNKPAASMKPGTPFVLDVKVKGAGSGSTPITSGATILVTQVNPTGVELFASPDVEGNIIPSNVLRYDPGSESWTNDKGIANADIGSPMKFVVLISYKGKTKVAQHTVNVR